MTGQWKGDDCLGLSRRGMDPLPHLDRNDTVTLAMYDQHGRREPADVFQAFITVAHQQPYRQKRVGHGADVGNRREGRIEDDATDRPAGGDLHGNPRAQQLAIENDVPGRYPGVDQALIGE